MLHLLQVKSQPERRIGKSFLTGCWIPTVMRDIDYQVRGDAAHAKYRSNLGEIEYGQT